MVGATLALAAVAMLPADRDAASFALLHGAALPTFLLFLTAAPRVLPGEHGREAMVGGFLAYVVAGAVYATVVQLLGWPRLFAVLTWPGFLVADLGCVAGLWPCLSLGA